MGALEFILILVGVVFLLGSFFLPEKLSKKELDKISELSDTELSHIIEKKLEFAKDKISNDLDDSLEECYDKVLRTMEKDSNEKIMAINEYSDSVLDSISKTHNEVMFLYSMLNDKYDELTSYANDLSSLKDEIQTVVNQKESIVQDMMDQFIAFREQAEMVTHSTMDENLQLNNNAEIQLELTDEELQKVRNGRILSMYKQGKTVVEIARELELGVGVVKLVLELYKGEE